MIDLARKDDIATKKLGELAQEGELVCITTINMAEFYAGIFYSRKKDTGWSENDAKTFLESFASLTLDHASARIWGKLAAELRSKNIGDRDLFIASIAIANEQTLITRNTRHFGRVPNLAVASW